MINKILKPASLLALCAAILVSCQKEGDDDSSSPKTNQEKITASAWKYDKASIDADKNGTADSDIPPGYIEACESDNTLTFKSDGSGVVDEGATKCESSNPQTIPFTWAFTSGETKINFPTAVFYGIEGDVTIKTLTDTKLELMKEVSIPGLPTSVNVILSLKH